MRIDSYNSGRLATRRQNHTKNRPGGRVVPRLVLPVAPPGAGKPPATAIGSMGLRTACLPARRVMVREDEAQDGGRDA